MGGRGPGAEARGEETDDVCVKGGVGRWGANPQVTRKTTSDALGLKYNIPGGGGES